MRFVLSLLTLRREYAAVNLHVASASSIRSDVTLKFVLRGARSISSSLSYWLLQWHSLGVGLGLDELLLNRDRGTDSAGDKVLSIRLRQVRRMVR